MSYYWKHGPHKTTVHYDIPPLKLASVSGSTVKVANLQTTKILLKYEGSYIYKVVL